MSHLSPRRSGEYPDEGPRRRGPQDRLLGATATTFRSLRVRNYRIFMLSQLVSVSGNWLQSVAQLWLVLHLTGSGLALGLVTAFRFAPILLFTSFGGLVADRVDKRRMLMVTQTAAGLLALTLAALTLSGAVRIWMVYLTALGLGCVNVFDGPGRQSFLHEVVGPRQISNAVALNSATFTLGRVIGPALAGIAIAWVGTGWCFLFNGLSYLPVILGLQLMRVVELNRSAPVRPARGQVRQGLRHAWERLQLRVPLLTALVVGLLTLNFQVLLPLLATRVFHGGPGAFGSLWSLMACGSVAGALLTAALSRPSQRLLGAAAVGLGALMCLGAVTPVLPLELVVLVPLGAAMIVFQATAQSLLQLNSESAFRGRVMALYSTVSAGSTAIGGPLVGWIAEQAGTRAAMVQGGVVSVLAGLLVLALIARRFRLAPGS